MLYKTLKKRLQFIKVLYYLKKHSTRTISICTHSNLLFKLISNMTISICNFEESIFKNLDLPSVSVMQYIKRRDFAGVGFLEENGENTQKIIKETQ